MLNSPQDAAPRHGLHVIPRSLPGAAFAGSVVSRPGAHRQFHTTAARDRPVPADKNVNLRRLTAIAADTVGAAQRRLPPEIRAFARAVPVHYLAGPDAGVLAEGFEPDILGLFTGNPHGTEISHADPAPPQILLYLENLWDLADGDMEAFREETRLTCLHELGHYFGWDEDELAARGLE